MLEHIPSTLGRMLKNVRPGLTKLFYYDPIFESVPETISLTSPSFYNGAAIPMAYTADGHKLSPPLQWQCVPPGAEGLVLIMEDADSPTPAPLTHAVIVDLPARDGGLDAGDFENYLPPDPPPGHGRHRYTFQLFALEPGVEIPAKPTKKSLREAMRGHVMAKAILTGTYERSTDPLTVHGLPWQASAQPFPIFPGLSSRVPAFSFPQPAGIQ